MSKHQTLLRNDGLIETRCEKNLFINPLRAIERNEASIVFMKLLSLS
jgi:hypothetical protein